MFLPTKASLNNVTRSSAVGMVEEEMGSKKAVDSKSIPIGRPNTNDPLTNMVRKLFKFVKMVCSKMKVKYFLRYASVNSATSL